ncbi:formin-like protein 3 [Portunus trituberculatus]|uniref:formin-like protein 3 n=1 Tax=Portunus trituberculatus TaxID=210409 RepID=UPI001E1CC298|nr:formin-like protein 3 [Portunus trituberculatus]
MKREATQIFKGEDEVLEKEMRQSSREFKVCKSANSPLSGATHEQEAQVTLLLATALHPFSPSVSPLTPCHKRFMNGSPHHSYSPISSHFHTPPRPPPAPLYSPIRSLRREPSLMPPAAHHHLLTPLILSPPRLYPTNPRRTPSPPQQGSKVHALTALFNHQRHHKPPVCPPLPFLSRCHATLKPSSPPPPPHLLPCTPPPAICRTFGAKCQATSLKQDTVRIKRHNHKNTKKYELQHLEFYDPPPLHLSKCS